VLHLGVVRHDAARQALARAVGERQPRAQGPGRARLRGRELQVRRAQAIDGLLRERGSVLGPGFRSAVPFVRI
jgi:hypothetical protein